MLDYYYIIAYLYTLVQTQEYPIRQHRQQIPVLIDYGEAHQIDTVTVNLNREACSRTLFFNCLRSPPSGLSGADGLAPKAQG